MKLSLYWAAPSAFETNPEKRDGSSTSLRVAVCQIHLDDKFNAKTPSEADKKQSIRADLDKAAGVPEPEKKTIDSDDIVDQWQKINIKDKDNVA